MRIYFNCSTTYCWAWVEERRDAVWIRQIFYHRQNDTFSDWQRDCCSGNILKPGCEEASIVTQSVRFLLTLKCSLNHTMIMNTPRLYHYYMHWHSGSALSLWPCSIQAYAVLCGFRRVIQAQLCPYGHVVYRLKQYCVGSEGSCRRQLRMRGLAFLMEALSDRLGDTAGEKWE